MRRGCAGYLLALIAVALWGSTARGASAVGTRDQEVRQSAPSFDARAAVVLGYFDRGRGKASVRWPRVAFAIGDGTLLLTAAHCVDDLLERSVRPVLPEPVVISPYYGDVFGFTIEAVDFEADLAILRAHWPAHPALALATEEELAAVEQLLIVSRPSARQDKPYRLSGDVRTELLPRMEAAAEKPNHAIQLEGTQKITFGWSGSAIVIPGTDRVAGVLGQMNRKTVRRAVFFRIPRVDALGCDIRSVRRLLGEHGLESAALRSVPPLAAIPDGLTGFSLAMDYHEALLNGDTAKSVEAAAKLVRLRPDSVGAHLMFAHAAAVSVRDANAPADETRRLAQASFEKALKIDPHSVHVRAAYADFLLDSGLEAEALTHAELALSLDPNDTLTQVNHMILLGETNPAKARLAGEQAVARDPNNPHLWFHFSSILLGLGEAELAHRAAQRAVDIDPNGLFYNALADALNKLGRLDEAENCYQRMTQRCACQQCWYNYAFFLVRRRESRLAEAAHALEMAEAASKRISDRRMNRLRLELLEKTAPKEAEAVVRRLLEKSPDDSEYWWYLATILRTQDRHVEAAQAARKAVDLGPERPYRARLANCLGKAGDLDRAQEVYDEMFELHPERGLYWYWYAQFLLDHFPDRGEEARTALDNAAATPDSDWSVSPDDLHELRERLDLEPAPRQ